MTFDPGMFKQDKWYIIIGTVKTGTTSLLEYLQKRRIPSLRHHDVLNIKPIEGNLNDGYIPVITTRDPVARCISDWYHLGCTPANYIPIKDYEDWTINPHPRPWWSVPCGSADRSNYNKIFDCWKGYDYLTIDLKDMPKLENFPHLNNVNEHEHQNKMIKVTEKDVELTVDALKQRGVDVSCY